MNPLSILVKSKKKNSLISRVLYLKMQILVIYLGQLSPIASSNLPAMTVKRREASSLIHCLFGLSTPEVYHHTCHQMCRGLLPRVFTLISLSKLKETVYFLWHFLSTFGCPHAAFLLGSRTLCVARTFLIPFERNATRQTVHYKGTNLYT